jgi:hypothetical protein
MPDTMEDQVAREQAAFDGDETTVEEMAEEEPELLPMQVPLEGFSDAITVTVGGARPQTSAIHLRGGKLPVEGEFKKGDVIELFVRARIAEVHFVDVIDKYEEVTGTERKHVAKPVAVRRLSASEE